MCECTVRCATGCNRFNMRVWCCNCVICGESGNLIRLLVDATSMLDPHAALARTTCDVKGRSGFAVFEC